MVKRVLGDFNNKLRQPSIKSLCNKLFKLNPVFCSDDTHTPGREEVRYVHELEHDLWDEAIEVGCICAGRLTGDIEEAKRLEKETRNRTSRRNNWLQRKWKESGKGNLYLKFRHREVRYHIVVFQSKYGQWNFRATLEIPTYLLDDPSPFAPINPLSGGFKTKKYDGTKWHKTLAQAQIAAFDAFF